MKRDISNTENWMIENERKITKEEIQEQLKSIMKICDPIMEQAFNKQDDYTEDL